MKIRIMSLLAVSLLSLSAWGAERPHIPPFCIPKMPPGAPRSVHPLASAPAGAYADYVIRVNGTPIHKMRMLVGRALRNGKPTPTLETLGGAGVGSRMFLEPPYEFQLLIGNKVLGGSDSAPDVDDGPCIPFPKPRKSGGNISMTTPAGTFLTERIDALMRGEYRLKAWISARVPVYGFVRIEYLGSTWELVGMGMDGVSIFPETYEVLPMETLEDIGALLRP